MKLCRICNKPHNEPTKACFPCKDRENERRARMLRDPVKAKKYRKLNYKWRLKKYERDPEYKEKYKEYQREWRRKNRNRLATYRENNKYQRYKYEYVAECSWRESHRYTKLVKLLFEAGTAWGYYDNNASLKPS